jgi:hypothetical protein
MSHSVPRILVVRPLDYLGHTSRRILSALQGWMDAAAVSQALWVLSQTKVFATKSLHLGDTSSR